MNAALSKKIITRDSPGTDDPYISYHITSLRVPLFEVDLGQAVYHGNYFHLFELGREEFLRNIGFPYRRFMDRQMHLTIVESKCTYRKPVRYDDMIEIHTGISLIRRRSLAFSQLIVRDEDTGREPRLETGAKQLCTQALLNLVCVRFSGQPTVLPEDFVEAVDGFLVNSHPDC
ncbi:MAG: acyl-CoA thioesterase [Syntrophobacteraceae bacterium]